MQKPHPPRPARLRNFLASLALLALAAAAFFALISPGALSLERARVIAADNSDLQTLGFVRYGTQSLELERTSGDSAGERFSAGNTVRGQMELDTIYSPGDAVIVTGTTVRQPWRITPLAVAFGLFALLLAAFGGATGLRALASFLVCALVIWKIVVPAALRGVNPSLVAFGATAAMTAFIMALVGGLTRKALAAFGGAMAGVAAALGLAHLLGSVLGVNGATLPYAQTLVYSGAAALDLAGLAVAATVIAASGAMMDLAMDIAAGIAEVSRHCPTLSWRALALSGIRIGRATVGTMTTTLLLAYSGGYLTLLMVFAASGTQPAVFVNSPLVMAEVAKTLVGSFALVLVAPFTAILSACVFVKKTA